MIKDILVTGAGSSEVNGIYRAIVVGGRMFAYTNDADTFGIKIYINDCWTFFDYGEENNFYKTNQYVDVPEDGTWIVADVGVLPVPTVTAIEPESGGGGAVSIQPISGRISL